MSTLTPQFTTSTLDLELKKGESAQFAVTVANYDLDLRGCLIFSEIRRLSPGYNLIPQFTGIVTSGSSVIQIRRYPQIDDKAYLLNTLPVRVGDLITLEGSGITGAKVIAITDTQIITGATATRSINEGRLLARSLSLASFTPIPYSPVFTLVLQNSPAINATQLIVSGLVASIPTGTTLAFVDGSTVKLATTSAYADIGTTSISVSPLSSSISANAIAKVGVQVIISSTTALASATSISVNSLSVAIPSGTTLNFANKSLDGWQYIGSATLSSSASINTTSISVSALKNEVPANSIAWFGTVPFKSFYLAIDPSDTQFLESGDYGYDVVCRQSNGYTIRVIQGNCKLTDHWSDGI